MHVGSNVGMVVHYLWIVQILGITSEMVQYEWKGSVLGYFIVAGWHTWIVCEEDICFSEQVQQICLIPDLVTVQTHPYSQYNPCKLLKLCKLLVYSKHCICESCRESATFYS